MDETSIRSRPDSVSEDGALPWGVDDAETTACSARGRAIVRILDCVRQNEATGGSAAASCPRSGFWRDTGLLWGLALFCLVLHLATASRFPLYEDELFGITIAKRSWFCSNVVFPLPLSLIRLTITVMGDSAFAIRFLPAVAGSANVLFTGLLARELGGGVLAVTLAGLGALVAPLLLFEGAILSSFTYDGLPCVISALLVTRVLRTGNRRLWWFVGLVWGLALLTKPTTVLFIMAIGCGLLMTQARGELLRKEFWTALVVVFVMCLPYLTWQGMHGWPALALVRRTGSVDEFADSGFWLAYISRTKMLLAQPAFIGPLNLALGIVGVIAGFMCRETTHRVAAWTCTVTVFALLAASGHPQYMNPLYGLAIAFGCVTAVRMTAKRARWLRSMLAAGLVVQGVVTAPVCVPILSRDLLNAYAPRVCRGVLAPLSAMFIVLRGSDEYKDWMEKLHEVYVSLPPSEQPTSCFLVAYGSLCTGSEYYGAKYHLPRMVTTDPICSDWGRLEDGMAPVIAAFYKRAELEQWFNEVKYAGHYQQVNIYICRSPKDSYQRLWPLMKATDWRGRWRFRDFPEAS